MCKNFNSKRLIDNNNQQINKHIEPQSLRGLNSPFRQTGQQNKVDRYLSVILSKFSRHEVFFKIVYSNSNGLMKSQREPEVVMYNEKIDLCLIAETHFTWEFFIIQ